MVPRSVLVALALALAGCRSRGDASAAREAGAPSSAPTRAPSPLALRPRTPAPVVPRPVEPVPAAGTVARIPARSFHLGSTPGELGRDPAVEVDGLETSVAAFDIDALPYPNDPAQPPRTGLSRDHAARLCAERGRRLCAEVEWELACSGPQETTFPGGASWDPARCGHGELGACASSFGVLALGTRFAEWTRDDLQDRAVIRGAGRDASAVAHRCAARRTAIASATGLEIAFRCCGGTPPAPPYPREISRRPFREEPMNSQQIAALIAQVPELERLHLREGLAVFSPAAITEVLNHGNTTAALHPEATFTVSPLRWSPTFGEELLVLVARSRPGSWVAALWVLPGNRYRHAASFLLRDDPVALTLAFTQARREVQWASCWNCGGEYGAVSYTDEGRVTIVQH